MDLQTLRLAALEAMGLRTSVYSEFKLNDVLDDLVIIADSRDLMGARYWSGIHVSMPHSAMHNEQQVADVLRGIKTFLNRALYRDEQLLRMQIVVNAGTNYRELLDQHERIVLGGRHPMLRRLAERRLAGLRKEMEEGKLRKYSMHVLVEFLPEYRDPAWRAIAKKDLSKFLEEEHVRNQVEAIAIRDEVLQLLTVSTGFQCRPMKTNDLREMLHEFFNPLTSRTMPPPEIGEHFRLADLAVEVQKCEPGIKPYDMAEATLLDSNFEAAPSGIFQQDGIFTQVLTLAMWPLTASNDCLEPIYTYDSNMHVILDIQATERNKILRGLRMDSNLSSSASIKIGGRTDDNAVRRMKKTDLDVQLMEDEGANMFRVSLSAVVRDVSESRLQGTVANLQTRFASIGEGAVGLPVRTGAVAEYFRVAPCSFQPPTQWYNLLDVELAHFIPVSGPFAAIGTLPRVLLHNPAGGLTSLDTDYHAANHYTFTGPTGGGKTLLQKQLGSMSLSVANPRKMCITDAGGSYNRWVQMLGGRVIRWASLISSGTAAINYFEARNGMDVTTLQNLCEGVMPETEQGRTLEQAVLEVLNAQVRMVNLMTADVTRNSENKLEVRAVLNKESESVLFECVLQSNLEAMQKGQEHFLSNIEEALRKKARVLLSTSRDEKGEGLLEGGEAMAVTCATIARRLERFTRTTYRNFFNRSTTLDLDAFAVVFDLGGLETLGADLLPVSVAIVMDFVWNIGSKNPHGIYAPNDEVWEMLANPVTRGMLEQWLRRGRSRNMIVGLLSQSQQDYLQFGDVIFECTSWKWILKPKNVDKVAEVVKVEGEKMTAGMLGAIKELKRVPGKFSDIFLISEDQTGSVRVKPTALDLAVATTDPKDEQVIDYIVSRLGEVRSPGRMFAACELFAQKFPEGIRQMAEHLETLPEQVIAEFKAGLTKADLQSTERLATQINKEMVAYFKEEGWEIPAELKPPHKQLANLRSSAGAHGPNSTDTIDAGEQQK